MELLEKGEITADVWLEEFLKGGAKTVAQIRHASARAGFAWATIKGAKGNIMAHSPCSGVWALNQKEEDEP